MSHAAPRFRILTDAPRRWLWRLVRLIRGTGNPVARCAPGLAALTTDELVARCLRLQVENHALREAGGLMREWIGNNEKTITERWDAVLPNTGSLPPEGRSPGGWQ